MRMRHISPFIDADTLFITLSLATMRHAFASLSSFAFSC